MKSNLRNEIKSYIVRQGMTMQEVVDLLHDEHGWSDSVSNLSNKFQRESLRYTAMRWAMKSSGSERKTDEPRISRKSHRDEGRTSIHGQALYVRPAEPIARTVACPGCFASLCSVQGAGLACRLGRRFKAFHALRSPPETRAPLRRLRVYPCPLCSGNHLLTQTISTAKSEQLFHQF